MNFQNNRGQEKKSKKNRKTINLVAYELFDDGKSKSFDLQLIKKTYLFSFCLCVINETNDNLNH